MKILDPYPTILSEIGDAGISGRPQCAPKVFQGMNKVPAVDPS